MLVCYLLSDNDLYLFFKLTYYTHLSTTRWYIDSKGRYTVVSEKFNKAKFWKCALQVNPASYIKYRGKQETTDEEEYNSQLLQTCLDEGIKIVGIADHASVDSIDEIRKKFISEGIIVFPGFEITSSEKVHFVCLFPEDTPKSKLHEYLGRLQINTDAKIEPSKLSAEQILSTIDEIDGFIFAAHCTEDNGVLKSKLQHVWKNPLLLAAQIPTTLTAIKEAGDQANYEILTNKTPAYKREKPLAIINATDVHEPSVLKKENASCLIKMTKPCFSSFKQAFYDPESRVRLNSDISEGYYSRIEKIRVIGGYLNNLEIDFSDHLNAIIGGKGTGKSTLIEFIRYALNLNPIGKSAQKQHKQIIDENLGKERAFVELIVKSANKQGNKYIISRRYGEESPTVKTIDGTISSFSPHDILPEIEIFGQSEIHEIAKDKALQLNVLERFLNTEKINEESEISPIYSKLGENQKQISSYIDQISFLECEIQKLTKYEEEAQQYSSLGLDAKLKNVSLIEAEKFLLKHADSKITLIDQQLVQFEDSLPAIDEFDDNNLLNLPDKDDLGEIKSILGKLKDDISGNIRTIKKLIKDAIIEYDKKKLSIESNINSYQEELEREFKKIPANEGKSGKEIGENYQQLLRNIEALKPKRTELEKTKSNHEKAKLERKEYLSSISEKQAARNNLISQGVKRINRRLDGKLKLIFKPESNRDSLIEFMSNFNLPNIGSGRLSWIKDAEPFSTIALAEKLRQGKDAIKNANWGCTDAVAEGLSKLSAEQIMKIEEFIIEDSIQIELNVSTQQTPIFKLIDHISPGQQCTAILLMLLLDNKDPLIMDQPEDNLDNAFIADKIVSELRRVKLYRQFVFATHNANIPVFGDAEWIGAFSASDENAEMGSDNQGSIDLPNIQKLAADLLEGGKFAFASRKEKYGFE